MWTIVVWGSLCLCGLAYGFRGGQVLVSPTWISSPLLPNETALAMKVGPVTPSSALLCPLPSGACLTTPCFNHTTSGTKFLLPASEPLAAYEVSLCVDMEAKNCSATRLPLNTPRVLWTQATPGGDTAVSGSTLRVFGHALAFDLAAKTCASAKTPLATPTHVTAVLVPMVTGQRNWTLAVTNASCWDLTTTVPVGVPAGSYRLKVFNGLAWTWSDQDTLVVQVTAAEPPWPSTIFNVAELGIAGAMKAAANNSGGIIFFPQGRYTLTAALTLNAIPPRTVVTGVAKELVSLVWSDMEAPPPALVTGPAGHFVLQNVTLYVRYKFNTIVSDGGFDGVRVLNVRVRANPNQMLLGNSSQPFRNRTLPCGAFMAQGDAFVFTGRNFELGYSDVYHGGQHLLNLDRSNAPNHTIKGAAYGHVHHNTFYYAVRSYHMESSQKIIFEHNTISGISLTSMGNDVTIFYGTFNEHLFFAHNVEKLMFGADHEMMTLDGGGGMYWGTLQSYSNGQVVLSADPVYRDYSPVRILRAAFSFLPKYSQESDLVALTHFH